MAKSKKGSNSSNGVSVASAAASSGSGFQPGKKATRFELRAMNVAEFGYLGGVPTGQQPEVAFEMCLVSVTGDGLSMRGTKEIETLFDGKAQVFTKKDVNALFRRFGGARTAEVGLVAIDRAEQGNGESCGVRFTLPQQLPVVQALIDQRRVELTRETPATPTSATP